MMAKNQCTSWIIEICFSNEASTSFVNETKLFHKKPKEIETGVWGNEYVNNIFPNASNNL